MEEEEQKQKQNKTYEKLDVIKKCKITHQIIRKSCLLMKETNKDLLRKTFNNLGNLQFMKVLEEAIEKHDVIKKKAGAKKFTIGNVFYKLIKEKVGRNRDITQKMNMIKRSKKIKKIEKDNKIRANIKKKVNSINSIKKKNKTNNIFEAFGDDEEME